MFERSLCFVTVIVTIIIQIVIKAGKVTETAFVENVIEGKRSKRSVFAGSRKRERRRKEKRKGEIKNRISRSGAVSKDNQEGIVPVNWFFRKLLQKKRREMRIKPKATGREKRGGKENPTDNISTCVLIEMTGGIDPESLLPKTFLFRSQSEGIEG